MKYGYRRSNGAPEEVIAVAQDGFDHKSKRYQWSDIRKIKRYDSVFWSLLFYQAGTPLAYIYLKDGNRIIIRGRFLERIGGGSGAVDFITGQSAAYRELLDYIGAKVT